MGQQAGKALQSPASQPGYKLGKWDILSLGLTVGRNLALTWPALILLFGYSNWAGEIATVVIVPFVLGIVSVVFSRRKGFDGLVPALISGLAGGIVFVYLAIVRFGEWSPHSPSPVLFVAIFLSSHF